MKFSWNEAPATLRMLPGVLVCLLTAAGCATQGMHPAQQMGKEAAGVQGRQVRSGDRASVHYLCRLRSGAVAAATDSVEEGQRKSNLYLPPEAAGPVFIAAVSADEAAQREQATPHALRSFEEEISHQLAFAIVGMKEGDRRPAELKAEEAPAQEASKYIARLTRVRTRPREMNMPRGDYEYRTHQTPEPGQAYSYDPDFPGRVESVSEQEVTIRFSAAPGALIETPFGPGRIREEGRDYKVDIEARKDALVRAGAMAGRIIGVDDQVITVDFGNPFGGEALLCEVTVDKIADDAKSPAGGE